MAGPFKYWQATAWRLLSGDVLELSEAQLYNAGARVDAAATLTCANAPDSGTLADLKDNSTATGAVWNTSANAQLVWTFPAAQAVDAVVLGARTTAARFPAAFVLRGASVLDQWEVTLPFGGFDFVSAANTAALAPGGVKTIAPIHGLIQQNRDGGNGRVRGTVKEKHTPANVPVFRRVRLIRERDGYVLREQWSDPATGAYDFQWVNENYRYTVLSYDHTENYQATANDNLTIANGKVELMP